ncbi:protein adenylyltransferase SelO family protein [Hyphobacterium sp.]|uniref:protein adenylyltransferase SelO family protein n=1 Tax=Hyphobacterium sp. TaxID=2004662 RepID=UPI003BA9C2C3
MSFKPESAFALLGPDFADAVEPADFPDLTLRWWNKRWADEIGLGDLDDAAKADHFARFAPLEGYPHTPLSMRYHGHQFRHYNPQIGDGRGFLFAQFRDQHDRLLDFGTKGSGQTPWSRSGDGRLTLKGAVREILAAEMLEALGVYTSKAFAVFETGEQLHRNDEPSPARGAVLTRLQHSHVRFGTFQRHAFEDAPERISALIDHAITVYYRHLTEFDGADRATELLRAVVKSSARLAAQWMAAGFVHGVLNTDNLNVTGESFDYGPWRFLPTYQTGFTAAYFDETGLYAYARQPEAVFWALQQFAAALLKVGETDPLVAVLNTFPDTYTAEMTTAFCRRLGVKEQDDSEAMVRALLDFLHKSQLPFEAVFFDHFCADEVRIKAASRNYSGPEYTTFAESFHAHEPDRPERLSHSYFQRPDPVHITIEVMEGAWEPVHEKDDWSELRTLFRDIAEAREGYDLGVGRIGFLP